MALVGSGFGEVAWVLKLSHDHPYIGPACLYGSQANRGKVVGIGGNVRLST